MITLVSGLPRSGTSLTMQMLKAGGFPVFWNREPNVDASNPRGYYEWADGLKLWEDTDEKLSQVDGKIVKLWPQCFPALSPRFEYQLIWVSRPLREVCESQTYMMHSKGKGKSISPMPQLEKELQQVLWHATKYIQTFPRRLLITHEMLYNGLAPVKLINFFGCSKVNHLAMQECVDPSLRHWQ